MAFSARLYDLPAQPVESAPVPRAILVPVWDGTSMAPETPARDRPETDRRWPALVRFAVIFGCASACWAMIGVPLLLIWG